MQIAGADDPARCNNALVLFFYIDCFLVFAEADDPACCNNALVLQDDRCKNALG